MHKYNQWTLLVELLKLTEAVVAALGFLTSIRRYPIQIWTRTISCFETIFIIIFNPSKIMLGQCFPIKDDRFDCFFFIFIYVFVFPNSLFARHRRFDDVCSEVFTALLHKPLIKKVRVNNRSHQSESQAEHRFCSSHFGEF